MPASAGSGTEASAASPAQARPGPGRFCVGRRPLYGCGSAQSSDGPAVRGHADRSYPSPARAGTPQNKPSGAAAAAVPFYAQASRSADLAPSCRAGGNAPLNGTDVLPVRGTRHLSTSALPSTLRHVLDVLVKEPPDAASGTTAAVPHSTRTSSTAGHNRTRRYNGRAERSGWIVADGTAGSSGTARPGRNREGRACHHRRPPGTGSRRRQAALIVARDWPGLAAKASRRRGIPVVPGTRASSGKGWPSHD